MNKAVFLDRDGVINQLVSGVDGPDSPRSIDEFRLIPGVALAIRQLNILGLPVVMVSNQPGVAKGKYPAENLQSMTEHMKSSLGQELAVLDGIYYCMHHPDALLSEYRRVCDCRKPKAGLLTQAACEMALNLVGSYMVGDRQVDMIAGKAVGCTTVFVPSGAQLDRPAEADHVCANLGAAALLIGQLESAARPI